MPAEDRLLFLDLLRWMGKPEEQIVWISKMGIEELPPEWEENLDQLAKDAGENELVEDLYLRFYHRKPNRAYLEKAAILAFNRGDKEKSINLYSRYMDSFQDWRTERMTFLLCWNVGESELFSALRRARSERLQNMQAAAVSGLLLSSCSGISTAIYFFADMVLKDPSNDMWLILQSYLMYTGIFGGNWIRC